MLELSKVGCEDLQRFCEFFVAAAGGAGGHFSSSPLIRSSWNSEEFAKIIQDNKIFFPSLNKVSPTADLDNVLPEQVPRAQLLDTVHQVSQVQVESLAVDVPRESQLPGAESQAQLVRILQLHGSWPLAPVRAADWLGWCGPGYSIVMHSKGSFIKKKKTFWWIKSNLPQNPPRPPLMWTMFFFHHCFIVLFQYLDIFFYIKSKKNTWKVDSDRNPPPHCGFNPSKCFFFLMKLP